MYGIYIRLDEGYSYKNVKVLMKKYGFERKFGDIWCSVLPMDDERQNLIAACIQVQRLQDKLSWLRSAALEIELIHIDSVQDFLNEPNEEEEDI